MSSSPHAQRGEASEGISAALARVPFLEEARSGGFEAERLNGALTNYSYKVTTLGGVYVLRLAGEGAGGYIDRVAEEHNARVAAVAGVNAEVLYFDAKAGTMLTRFVDGAPMDGEQLRRDPVSLARAVLALRRVHRLGRAFQVRFDPFARIGRYLDLLYRIGVPPPHDYLVLERDAEAIRTAIAASPTPLAPCHNDPWPGNLLDTGERVFVIDWEYSGMNDPAWDLADLSVEAGLGPEQERVMLEAYLGGPVPRPLLSRVQLYKAVSDLHWGVWALVQHANGNPAEDFRAYAAARLERCKRQMDEPDFGRHLGVVLVGRAGLRSPARTHRTERHPGPKSAQFRDSMLPPTTWCESYDQVLDHGGPGAGTRDPLTS